MTQGDNRKILLIDDNTAIHEDFKKILTPGDGAAALDDARSAFLGGGEVTETSSAASSSAPRYDLHSAFQGEEGYDLLCEAFDAGEPFAMAFVDMRMPPGWDGVETIARLWEKDPDLQVVVCTAFSDYTWEETVEELGQSDRLLILKKPFDAIEIAQLAAALTTKWNLMQSERELLAETRQAHQEARAYASSLETVNRALVTSKAASDMALELRTEFLVQVSNEVNLRLSEVLGGVEALTEATADLELSGELACAMQTSEHLLYTIDEVLDVTALERGRASIEYSTCSPRRIVDEVMAEFDEQAREKGVELRVTEEAQAPRSIESDPLRLHQILHSLVENALHHTESGSVEVTLRSGQTEDWQRPRLVVDVVDTGAGIPKERMGAIFEPAPRDESNPRSGFGFGLALARRLAVLLEGDITARSAEGEGATFTLTVDHGTANQAAAA